jgi:hypothetical protein
MSVFILDTTTKTVKASMSGASTTNNPDFVVSYADNTGSAFTEGSQDGVLNGTSDVTLVSAPASLTRRVIKNITIQNTDTAAVTITIVFDNNGTQRQVAVATLQVNDVWTLSGVFDSSGNLKTVQSLVNLATNVTGTLPEANGGTGITSFGTGVATFLGTPSSANLAAAVTDETGTGSLVFATSPTFVTPVLGTPTSGTLSSCTVDGTDAVGFRNTPVNSQSAAYETVLADSGKTILHPVADDNARTFTIPANSSVAYPVGTVISFVNLQNTVTIEITDDTMYLANDGDTGNRTLAEYGMASAMKVASTTWIISGNGLT